jgi:DNA-binding IclR family transcriptional regulator
MTTTDEGEKTIGATETVFDIIESIARNDSPTLSAITNEVDCSRSTVYYHLRTLEQNRYIFHDDGGYQLGLRMAHFSEQARRHQPFHGAIGNVVENLAEETGMTAFVGVEEGGKLVCFSCFVPESEAELAVSVGREFDLHCLAHGQTVLSSLERSVVEEIVSTHGLPEHTDATLTDTRALFDRLETIGEFGVAYSPEEHVGGVSTVAAPVGSESTEAAAGAVGIAGPAERIDDPYKQAKARRFSDELPEQIRRSSRILTNNIHGD